MLLGECSDNSSLYIHKVQRLVAKETDMPRHLDADALQRELEEVRVNIDDWYNDIVCTTDLCIC